MSEFDPNKGDFGIGNGINEYNDQEEQAKLEREKRPADARTTLADRSTAAAKPSHPQRP